jgi:hypothetical protein
MPAAKRRVPCEHLSTEVDVLSHGTAVTVLVLLPKRRLWRSAF